jgi:hypothetical protein
MPIVISRTGNLNVQAAPITQDQRDALWAAFVTNWLNNNQQQFSEMLAKTEKPGA